MKLLTVIVATQPLIYASQRLTAILNTDVDLKTAALVEPLKRTIVFVFLVLICQMIQYPLHLYRFLLQFPLLKISSKALTVL